MKSNKLASSTKSKGWTDERSETVHNSKRTQAKSKASEKEARVVNNPTPRDYDFTFDGTSYVAIQKGGNYNVRTK